MSSIPIKVTIQSDKLKHATTGIRKEVTEAALADEPGTFLTQILFCKNDRSFVIKGRFFPRKYAKRIQAVMKECVKEMDDDTFR